MTLRASSASAPADSTPVAPAPTTTKLSAPSSTSSRLLARVLKQLEDARAHAFGVVERVQREREFLRARGVEEVRLGACSEDQNVTLDRAVVRERDRPRLRVGRNDVALAHLDVRIVVEDRCEVERDVLRRELCSRDLVEERLELVVAVLVEQRDADALLAGEPFRDGNPRETSADDHDVFGAVLAQGIANLVRLALPDHHPEGVIPSVETWQVIRFA